MGIDVGTVLHADQFKQFSRAFLLGRFGKFLQAEGYVVPHIEVREQGVVLEDHADLAFFGRGAASGLAEDLTCQADAATVDVFESGYGAQGSGFATAAGAEQAADMAFGQVE